MRLFLAAAETAYALPLIRKGLFKNAFFSFYILRKRNKFECLVEGRNLIETIIIDSGAHTFFTEMGGGQLSATHREKKNKLRETPDQYWESYKEWLLKFDPLIDYFVELDIGEIVGKEKVLKWREELKSLGLFHKCITVYHPAYVTEEEYMQLLEQSASKYVGLEGIRGKRSKMLPYKKLVKMAYDRGVKVHGFAMIKKDILHEVPFYSVDSSSWLSSVNYGFAYTSDMGVIRLKDAKALPKLFKLAGKIANIRDVYHSDTTTNYLKRYEISIKGFHQLEDYFNRLWEKRGIAWQD